MGATNIFISYSHKDFSYLERLTKFVNNDFVTDANIWYDKDIEAGEIWSKRIERELEAADIVLLIVTINSLTSGYVKKEMDIAFKRLEKGECAIIPIFAENCVLDKSDLGIRISQIQGYPVLDENGRSFLSQMGKQDADQYKKLNEELNKRSEAINKQVQQDLESKLTNKNIFFPAPKTPAELAIYNNFIEIIGRTKEKENFAFDIVPDPKNPLNDPGQLERMFADALYTVHILASHEEMPDLIKALGTRRKGDALSKSIIIVPHSLMPDIDIRLKAYPIVREDNTEQLFSVIESFEHEKSQDIIKLKKKTSLGKILLVMYDEPDGESEHLVAVKEKFEERECKVRLDDEEESLSELKRHLEESDGAIIFYGQAAKSWFSCRQNMLLYDVELNANGIYVCEPDVQKKVNKISKNDFEIFKDTMEENIDQFLNRL